jgi:hypothetical protein
MSVSISSPLVAPVTVAVAPTETTVCSFKRGTLQGAKRITIQVSNLDATQTFNGTVYRRKAGMAAWAPSTIPDFTDLLPLTSVMADLDVEGTDELEVRGTMSGSGGDVEVGATRKAATP